MRVSKIMGVVVAVFVALSMLASTMLAVHAESKIVGDVDLDRDVDTRDIGLVNRAMWTTSEAGGTPGQWWAWNPTADVNGDGEVNGLDQATVTLAYGYYA